MHPVEPLEHGRHSRGSEPQPNPPYEDHLASPARSIGSFTEPEDPSSHLMDECSRLDIPPAVTEPHRPAGARPASRARVPGRISAHLPAAQLDQLAASRSSVIDPR